MTATGPKRPVDLMPPSEMLSSFLAQELQLGRMKSSAFYLGIALLFTHELDAMPNHEWRMFPGLNLLPDAVGETMFLLAHIPLFVLVIAFVASLNVKTRATARGIASAFLIVHAAAHYLFSGNSAYEFSSVVSSVLIYGAAVCGIGYFAAIRYKSDRDAA